jgi:hypothetical protein
MLFRTASEGGTVCAVVVGGDEWCGLSRQRLGDLCESDDQGCCTMDNGYEDGLKNTESSSAVEEEKAVGATLVP